VAEPRSSGAPSAGLRRLPHHTHFRTHPEDPDEVCAIYVAGIVSIVAVAAGTLTV
jgi:hypothetical protein